ncbi:glycosyltransferase family 4 protein [Limnofasciculus baicalensis]|uniref:Glycosyltransferase family 4 protein n=1 Tax=Limnofasciculus baicalensis BBK-W-15 TaxID=2699891 RepID=A0AAE3GTT0_9CYAN|nr:glycosyltransferase family 1 protein [Limnofasciculus baicalensis]MCP2729801.1 glycosyltransferase family 4 protein [Limnofasciculus baicalensis BBK-W-15]
MKLNSVSSRDNSLSTSELPINIALDISTLGSGYRFGQKAGIFRFSYELSRVLIDAPDCNLSFCSGESLELLIWTKRFLEANPDLSRCPFILHNRLVGSWKNIQKSYQFIEELIDRIHQLGFTRSKRLKETLVTLVKPTNSLLELNDLKDRDIYHSLYHAIPLELKSLSLKKFITIHDLIPILYPQFFIKEVRDKFREIINSLDSDTWIICNSESTKRDLCNYRPDLEPQKIFVTHLAASDSFYPCLDQNIINRIKEKYTIPSVPYILSLSTLEIRKNVPHLICCFLKLVEQEKIEDLHLVLVGRKGWLDNNIYSEISNLDPRLRERIIFTGYVPDEDLAPLYSGSLVFVYPSLYEGFGLPPLEAMQCGTPVITSNTSSLPEVVGNAGIRVAPLDEDSLCHSIWEIYQNDSLRNSLSTKSIEQAAKFSWEKCLQQTISAYRFALVH